MARDSSDKKHHDREKDVTAEIHLPPEVFDVFKEMMDLDHESFDRVFVERIFPEGERFGLEHIKLVSKATPSPPPSNTTYRKTCSST